MALQFPLKIRFKLVALAPRMWVTDANGANVCYVSQKVLALKEDITVFQDDSRTTELFKINADRIADFTTTYHFTEAQTRRPLGAVKSKGWRSIWKATYEVKDPQDNITHKIIEENPWVKVLDALFQEIPFAGMFAGYVLNPKFIAVHPANEEQPVMRLTKQPAFFEGVFQIDKIDPSMSPEVEESLLLSFMLMVQFMRRRG